MSDSARWIDWEAEKVTAHFRVDPSVGLSEEEAQKRLKQVGTNQLSEGEKISLLALFVDQFKDFMVLVLLAATLISGLLGEYTDAIAIIAIVLLNAILGFVQEVRAEKSLSALKKLSAPTARVLRNGKWLRLDASKLVPGDIVHMESGDRLPADVRFLKTENLYVEESALTGESVPVAKNPARLPRQDVSLGDRKNMGYMGTMAVRGKGVGVVVHTGMDTEMGKIAHLIESTDTAETPLQRRLEQLGKVLIVVALILTAVVVITGILHGHDVYKMFLAGVSLAVAAIPEGLPAIVTIALALGVQRMIKRKAIVRKLPSVETLGCATVICSDKTGTLTQNKMMVTRIWADGRKVTVSGNGYIPEGAFACQGREINPSDFQPLRRILEISVLCNNASLLQEKEKGGLLKIKKQVNWLIDGDPTEGALLVAGAKAGLTSEYLSEEWKRVKEFPFDSERKMMSVLLERKDGRQVLYTKGAPDILLAKCTRIVYQEKTVPLTDSLRAEILRLNEEFAGMALRNLAFAYREITGKERDVHSDLSAESQLTFVGLAGMIDPPREEVKEAIRICHRAGIKTAMITGDHQATAMAIATELGILRPGGLTLNGRDLYNMNDEEFLKKVNDIDVYARVSPEHKLRIVKALQKTGHVVAMTGDGVNDAPAIKAADIGIAMGISGTDVSKEASSLVLADDNFATIVAAIEEGRSIYDNIRKFISYLLASNVGEILVMFLAMLAGLPLPLVPIQILWVNLVTDGLPAMALGVDPAQVNSMDRPPRNSRESVFARGVGWKIVTRGLLIGLCSLAAFWVTYSEFPDDLVKAQTVAFSTLVFAQLIYVFDCRSTGSIFNRTPFDNRALVLAVISSALLLLGVIYYPPLQPIFHTVPLGFREWILVLVTSTLPVLIAGLLDQIRPASLKKAVQG
ncbi:calcium-translocating P-type ATPase, SERCA-type [Paenactinomyces guangxiensis]|uniref:calcium-translocating P-type ATPase, SERCA-type n=1 Tax=Paenactinomyces guangxiensis TaxID=1490290 RepID=UPI0035A8FEA3